MLLPGGWFIKFQTPVHVCRPNPRNWACNDCGRFMRVEQMTYDGDCPRCGGHVRKTKVPPHRSIWRRRFGWFLCRHKWSEWWLAPPGTADDEGVPARFLRRCWRCGNEEMTG